MKAPLAVVAAMTLGALSVVAADPKRPTEIAVGMDYDAAAKILRDAGAREGRFFDAVYIDPPPKWNDFALPDLRTITLHAKPSEVFPSIFRVTAIFVVHPNDSDPPQIQPQGRPQD